MRRSVLAVTGAVMLSMIPATPPALALPFSFNPAVITSDSGPVVEVSHRKKCGRTRKMGCGQNLHHHHRHHHRHHHHGGACIRFNGFTICF